MVQIYPTASTSAVFLNGIHVDEAYSFGYKANVPKVPIYGYNDYEYSKVVRGKGIVQGMLVVNFTFPGYLGFVLDKQSSAFVPRLYNYSIEKENLSTIDQYGKSVIKRMETELPSNDTSASRAERAEFIASLVTKKDRTTKATIKKAINSFFSTTGIETTSIIPNTLTKDSKIGNVLDVYYMDPNLSLWFNRFNSVEFTEEGQTISQAGAEGSSEPLYTIYQFIAKNVETVRVSRS